MALLLNRTKISNIGPISNVELEFQGPGVYVISGKNNAGKTTCLTCLDYLLRAFPRGEENPLKNGEKSGEIIAWLKNSDNGLLLSGGQKDSYKYKLSRKFTEAGAGGVTCEYVGVGELKKPRAVLDQFLSDLKSLDPWAFIQMKDQDQVNALLKIVKIPLDRNRLAEIAGFNTEVAWPESDLECMDQLVSKLYLLRQDTNRYLDRAKAVLADNVIPEERKKTQYVKLADLMNERKILEEQEKENNAGRLNLTHLNIEKDQLLQVFNTSMEKQNTFIAEADRQIAELKTKIRTIENNRKAEISKRINVRKILKDQVEICTQLISKQKNAVETLVPVDYTDIDSRIAQADEANEWAGKVEKKQLQEAEIEKLSKESIDYTLKISRIAEYKRELLSRTKFPCEGLSFADGKVTLRNEYGRDIPLKKQGGAEQLIAAFEILRAQDPELRVVLSFTETQTDKEHAKLLEDLAVKNGFQFLRCQVAEQAEDGRFFIENGVLSDG